MSEPVNPFVIPGKAAHATTVLQPYLNTDHDALYVDVCGTKDAYVLFQQEFDFSAVEGHGGFILVVGDSGCGKSALIARCVAHLGIEMGASGLTVHVLDLTDVLLRPYAMSSEKSLTIEQRTNMVGVHLFDKLQADELLVMGAEEILKDVSDYLRPMRLLDTLLREDVVLVVNLPSPHDLIEEVVRYAYPARVGRVVFTAESDLLGPPELAHLERLAGVKPPPFAVTVSNLTRAEVEMFLTERLNSSHLMGIFPTVSVDGLDYLRTRSRSIKTLQTILFKTYSRMMRIGTDYRSDYEVTRADFVKFGG